MSRSPSPSATSVALLALLAFAGCGDDECGTGGAQPFGLAASSVDVTLTYGDLSALAGNDCPAPDAPAGVVSLSIEGRTVDGTGLITLCIPRPDLLATGNRTLGTSLSMADIRIFDLNGVAGSCMYTLDSTRPPTGTATGSGVCGNGTDPAGFELDVDGAVSLRRDCAGTIDTIAVTLAGRVAVSARAQ